MSEPTSNLGGMGAILADLLKDLQNLVRGEIALARAEVRDDLATAGKGIGALVVALIFGLTGFIFVMLAATYVLNLWVRMWIAAGIVGAALVLFALIFAMSGKKQLSATSLKPDQTINSLKENQAWAKQQIKSATK